MLSCVVLRACSIKHQFIRVPCPPMISPRFDLKVENDSSQEDQNIKKTQVIMVGTKRNWR